MRLKLPASRENSGLYMTNSLRPTLKRISPFSTPSPRLLVWISSASGATLLDESTKAKVHADIELATRLNVSATPTVFLNGRPVSDRRPQAVRVLIDHLLKQQPPEPSGAPHQRVAAASSGQLGVAKK